MMKTDAELMREFGRRLAALRERQGLTAIEVAERTKVARRTIYRAERGLNPTIGTIVRLLRLYGRLDALEQWLPEPEVSPMALLERRKASRG